MLLSCVLTSISCSTEATPKMVTVIIRERFCIEPMNLRNVHRVVQPNVLRGSKPSGIYVGSQRRQMLNYTGSRNALMPREVMILRGLYV
jgi:hypothetical protein